MLGLMLILALLQLTAISGFRASWRSSSGIMRITLSKQPKFVKEMHLKQTNNSDQSVTLSKKGEGMDDEVREKAASDLKRRYIVVPLLTMLIGSLVWVYMGNSPLGVVDMNHVLDRAVDRIAASGPMDTFTLL